MAIALLFALAANGAAPAAEGPVVIDAILTLTGQNAFLGNEERESLQIAEDVINHSGGIRGRPVRIEISDDQTNPQLSVQLTNRILAKHPAVLLGLGIASACNAVMPLVNAAGPVTFCFTPAVDLTPGSYVFSSTVSTTDTAAVGLRYFRAHGWTRVAFIASSDATGQQTERVFDNLIALPENKELRVIARERFNVTDLSVNAQMVRIKAAKPDAVFSAVSGTPFGTLLRGMSDVGLDVPLHAALSNMTFEQMAQYAAFLPHDLSFSGNLGMRPGIVGPGPIRDAQRVFFRAIADRGVRPSAGLNISWDATMLVADALAHLGLDATAAQMHDYVEQLQGWAGINGIYRFRGNTQRGIGRTSVVVFRWDAARHDFVAASKPGGSL